MAATDLMEAAVSWLKYNEGEVGSGASTVQIMSGEEDKAWKGFSGVEEFIVRGKTIGGGGDGSLRK
jgi:hypothetical protein